jgi:hypothetical protein
MIEFVAGDILQADTEAIVNAVNCVGVMGRGLVAQFWFARFSLDRFARSPSHRSVAGLVGLTGKT